MKIGFIGLGKMGLNMALNVSDKGWKVIGFDVNESIREKAAQQKLKIVHSLADLLKTLGTKRVLFLSIPAGNSTNQLIFELVEKLREGDIIIDSGNSNYNDSLKNYEFAKRRGVHFIDCGTSGGIEGARNGACLMIGGDEKPFKEVEPFFKTLACKNGYLYAGRAGSGHYLKMVHNGIEYAMMQALGEGFDVLHASDFEFNLEEVAQVWNHGSVIRSWLIELIEEAFSNDPTLEKIKGEIDATGEAKWTIEEALNLNISVPTIALSLFVRNESKNFDSFSNKVVASLRHGFGGHTVIKNK